MAAYQHSLPLELWSLALCPFHYPNISVLLVHKTPQLSRISMKPSD
jgi:hypothetical protein